VFAPLAFAVGSDRAAAGQLAGAGFTLVAYASLALGAAVYLCRPRTVGRHAREALYAFLPGLILVACHLLLRPLMAAHGPGFALAHGASSAGYGLATIGVVALWVRDERRVGR
jgi:hypothetical protein